MPEVFPVADPAGEANVAEEPPPSVPDEPGDPGLMDLDEAVAKIPEGLRREMKELLRAEFRQVIRWKPD